MIESREICGGFRGVIGVVGSRKRNSEEDRLELVRVLLDEVYTAGDIICSGGCSKGADAFVKQLCALECIPYLEFPANWDKYGKSAGPIRNKHIADVSDTLIAMLTEDSVYKGGTYKGGTESTVKFFIELHGKDRLIIL